MGELLRRAARPGDLQVAVAIAFVALAYASVNARIEWGGHVPRLDPDGQGAVVGRLKAEGRSLASLFDRPSLWKGPIVPFVFGAAYYIAPLDASPLVFNGLAFAVGAALLYLTFRELGSSKTAAVVAVSAWIFYLAHRYIFGYYFAEPMLTLFVAAASLALVRAITAPTAGKALAVGALTGLLLLARASFIIALALVTALLWRWLPAERRRPVLGPYLLAGFLVFAPWPIRNLIMHRAVIPFTTEGGKILFQGVWLPGDDVLMSELRAMPQWNAIERGERGLDPVEQYRYWQRLAGEHIRAQPLGQLRLCLRKALRFWMYLPPFSWRPALKTAAVAAIGLPLALVGLIRARHSLLAQLCAAWVGGLWLFHSLVHAELRYHFPVLPMACMLAVPGALGLAPSRRAL